MKKFITLILVLATLLTLAACGKNKGGEATTAPKMELPDSALTLLNTVWASYADADKFPAMGGNYNEDESKNNNVDNAPGKFDIQDEGMTATLMVPADKLSQITDAASLMHGMMANNFTCGAYKLAEGSDAKAFGEAMHKSITEQRFLCGAPEAIFVAILDNEYVVAAYGMKDLLDNLQAKLSAAYPGTQVLYSKVID